jgi:hypothetical protein
VAGEPGVPEQAPEDGLRDAVGDEVLLDDDVDAGPAREHGGVAEDLPLLEHLDRLAVALEAHRALADDVEVLEAPLAGAHEPGAGRMEGDVHRARRLLEERRRQRPEGRGGAEVGGGVRRGHQKKSVR